MTTDPYLAMDPVDRLRAIAYAGNQKAIQQGRERAARALLAPPGPARTVKVAWAPVSPRVAVGIDWKADAITLVALGFGLPEVALDGYAPTPFYMDLETGAFYQAQEATP